MDESRGGRRTTVHDVARAAGVSLATVDRVLNARPGVRPETAGKVEEAIRALDFRRDLSASLLARARDLSIAFLIPDGGNEFMQNLAAAVARRGRASRPDRLQLETVPYRALDSRALADGIDGLGKSVDCAVIVATEAEPVRAAVERASRRGLTVLTLVSDLPGSARRRFIGIDNVAAGRTAASLMGRFCAGGGKVGLIAGSLALRDHRERRDGFSAVMTAEYPEVELVGPIEGFDDNTRTARVARELLADPELRGIYNLGAGNGGLLRALQKSGRSGELHVIAHELSEVTRDGLRSGAVDVVLDQNPDGEIRAAVAAARAVALGQGADDHAEPIEIGIFLRDNLR